MNGKPASASAINDQTAIVFPDDLNSLGTLFGGRVMEQCDRTCAVVAKRHGDILVFKAAVNRVWRTSMEIGVKVFAEDFRTMARKHIVSAYFTFVAVDESLRPIEIAPIIPETEDEKRRYREADERRQQRMRTAAPNP